MEHRQSKPLLHFPLSRSIAVEESEPEKHLASLAQLRAASQRIDHIAASHQLLKWLAADMNRIRSGLHQREEDEALLP